MDVELVYYKEVLKYSDIYINNFVGHTDATETTKNIVEVTQVFLQCIEYIFSPTMQTTK